MSPFTERKLPDADCITALPDLSASIALTAAAVVLSAPVVGACVIGGLTYSLLQPNKAG